MNNVINIINSTNNVINSVNSIKHSSCSMCLEFLVASPPSIPHHRPRPIHVRLKVPATGGFSYYCLLTSSALASCLVASQRV